MSTLKSDFMNDNAASVEASIARKRVIVYVDGFNLYFGLLKANPHLKWLDLQSFAESTRPNEDLVGVRYFTALVDPERSVSESRDRQKRYIKALESKDKVKVIYGKYQKREVECRARCRERYEVPEEKKTNVGIAVHMLSDVIDGLMDGIILISGDSDLEPAVEWIRKRHNGIKITVYIPQDPSDRRQRRNDTYRNMGVDARPLPITELSRFQFPRIVDLGSGRKVERPAEWT